MIRYFLEELSALTALALFLSLIFVWGILLS